VGIEAVHDDRDLRMVVHRAEFEARADELFHRLKAPLKRVMAQANWTIADVHRVEVIGGATRIPRVKEVAKEFFQRTQLDGSINGNLLVSLFAAYANISFSQLASRTLPCCLTLACSFFLA